MCHRNIKPQILLLNPRNWYLESLQFLQVGLYLEAGSIDEPVPFQFPFGSYIWSAGCVFAELLLGVHVHVAAFEQT